MRDLGSFNTADGGQIEAWSVGFRQGGTFQYWVDLFNDGSRTLTITQIGPPVPVLGQPSRKQWEISVQIAHPNGTGAHFEAFHPITLGPQENVGTLVTVHMNGCMAWSKASQGWEVFGDTPVTYTVPFATVHALVPMDFSVTMHSTQASACPGPG
jgi:hypothetical protein